MKILPVVDIFAGPGGLSEGFSSIERDGERLFHVCLSVESDDEPFKTLRLRAFFNEFRIGSAPIDYYRFLRGEIDSVELFLHGPNRLRRLRMRHGRPPWETVIRPSWIDELQMLLKAAGTGYL